jgi:exosortase
MRRRRTIQGGDPRRQPASNSNHMPELKAPGRAKPAWFLGIGLFALLWAYWPSFVDMAERWAHSAEYSHGYLVPLLALGLLWQRYDRLGMGRPKSPRLGLLVMAAGVAALFLLPTAFLIDWGFLPAGVALVGAGLVLRPEEFDPDVAEAASFRPDAGRVRTEAGSFGDKLQPTWWGLPLLAGGIVLRLVAGHYYIGWFDQLSLIPCVAGIVLLTVGPHAARWAWPAVAFLVFMVPLPFSLEAALRDPLRSIGTKASTYLMQTVGLPAFADGNRHEILVGGMTHRIGVTEACSGLSMLMIFVALSAAVAVVIRRPLWERAVILASALPIALVANVLRITVTGMMIYALQDRDVYLGLGGFALIDMSGGEFAQSFFHDWAGWLMMPLALLLMWLELQIMQRLIIVEYEDPLSIGIKGRSPQSERTADPGAATGSNSTKTQDRQRGAQTPAGIG